MEDEWGQKKENEKENESDLSLFPSLKKVLKNVIMWSCAMEEWQKWGPEKLADGSHKTWNTENLLRLTFPVSGRVVEGKGPVYRS